MERFRGTAVWVPSGRNHRTIGFATSARRRSRELTLIAERIRRGETIEDFETRTIRKDGRTLEVSLTLSPIRETGRVVGVLCLGVDVSERNRLVRAERNK